MIYWIRADTTEYVKVGYTVDIKSRIKLLQTNCPFGLTLLRQEPGNRALEIALHRHYNPKRKRGEWFFLSAADIAVDLVSIVRTTPIVGARMSNDASVCPVNDLIENAGGAVVLAKKLGIDRCTVLDWKRAKAIPPSRAFQIHDVLGLPLDALRAVTRNAGAA